MPNFCIMRSKYFRNKFCEPRITTFFDALVRASSILLASERNPTNLVRTREIITSKKELKNKSSLKFYIQIRVREIGQSFHCMRAERKNRSTSSVFR